MGTVTELLRAQGLTKSYRTGAGFSRGRFTALREVSLAIGAGETVGLIGESGCGKTTLGQIVARILEPDSGRVVLRGVDLLEKNAPFDRHAIQMVFQDPNGALNPSRKIRWILHEALRAKGIGAREKREEKILEMLPRVGLDGDYLGRYPHELSGGQKQRVAILLAVLMEPQLIVADEVVSSLDVSVRAQILNLLQELQQTLGISYLFISHDLNIVYYMSRRIAVMYLGEIVEEGSADAVYHGGRHPYTRLLLSSLLDYQGAGGRLLVEQAGDLSGSSRPAGGCPFAGRCPHTREICTRENPALAPVEEGHRVRCHLVRDGAL